VAGGPDKRGDHVTSEIILRKGSRLRRDETLALLPEQLHRFTRSSVRAKHVHSFDAQRSLDCLRDFCGRTVLAIDIGGDKISASYFTVGGGALHPSGDVLTKHGDDGAGYLDALRELSDLARSADLPVGISFAGPTNGTRIVAAPNLSLFMREFQDHYNSDFGLLFPKTALANDAEAGIMAGALEAAIRLPSNRNVIYVINGSGLGGAVLAENTIYAAEPGHIDVVERLNHFGGFNQLKPCGLDGASHVCLEAVGASKAGIEDIWHQITGDHRTGRQLAALYRGGNELARVLYDNSALITAHVIVGMAAAFGLLSDAAQPVVVAHGGIFQASGYGDRVREILVRSLPAPPTMLFTKDFSGNTCLEGAAIAAATKPT
jgi:predicted NBD/HSP70 family sugar kinase